MMERSKHAKWLVMVAAGAVLVGLSVLGSAGETQAEAAPEGDAARLVESCANAGEGRESWVVPAPPARIHGETYYVGTCGITALLVTSDKGHVLLDGGPGEAAKPIAANIEKLGFKLSDVRWIVSSHEHFDHVGGLAELKRVTGAKVAALAPAAATLRTGKVPNEDPQHGSASDFAPVAVDRILRDGDEITVGPLRLTVHATPSHAPGSASWTWKSCAGSDCRTIAYADSATLISADGYRYTDHPERVAAAKGGLARMKALPCDILITPHPEASDLFPRLVGKESLNDSQACRHYVERGETRFAQRLADEAKQGSR